MSETWEIEEDDYGDELWYGGAGCGLICVNGWTNGGCKENPEEWEELKKQARLIAAAPDLLAFAQEFLADYQSEDGMDSIKHYAARALAAIAKAEGKPC